jgi:hypothetical protein
LVESVWRRYCDTADLPMGRVVLALIVQELRAVVEDHGDAGVPLLAGRVTEGLGARRRGPTPGSPTWSWPSGDCADGRSGHTYTHCDGR